jgi:ubiquinone/menaquinone biosynthesis C-methylase UbiE
MTQKRRAELERQYHESEDRARQDSRMIRSLYGSGVFEEALAYHRKALGDIEGRRVLDYGCGGGYESARLRALGARVVGFDISRTRLAEAQDHLLDNDAGLAVDLVQCAAGKLPFADASFDAVHGKWILHHLELEDDVPEIVRVLKSGGRAAFIEPLVHNPVLQTYRRLTPHLRSPDERSLSMKDLQSVGSHFHTWQHKEFVLFSVLPALASALMPGGRPPPRLRERLQRLDRKLMDVLPVLGRYCWETVILLER